jgi:hypothetical protein
VFRTLAYRFRNENGSVLVMGLGLTMVLMIGVATVLSFSSENVGSANYGNAEQKAYALAEEGVNNAVSVLNGAYGTGTVLYPGDSSLLPTQTTQVSGGSVTWGGTLQQVSGAPWTWQWALSSTASLSNPIGPGAAPVKRTVRAIVPVVLPLTSPVNSTSVLNFIYAGTDITFTSSVSVGSPVYATRDLSLANSSTIKGTASKVGVGRNLYLGQPQNQIGLLGGSDPRLGEIHVVGQCSSKATPALHACGPTSAGWDADKVFATVEDGTIPPGFITPPVLTCCAPVGGAIAPSSGGSSSSMGFWYVNAAPGPKHPCDPATMSGTPPTFDTGDDTINNSATPATPFNLTPEAADYTCKAIANGTVIGELSWNHTTRVLTANGTIFIDGSATVDRGSLGNTTVFTYSGEGTIYLSGTFSIKSTILCAVGGATDCNFAPGAWDPNQKALVIVADGDGGLGGAQSQSNVVGSGIGIQLVSASFQGALIANKAIGGGSATSSKDQGPIVSVYGAVVAGQSGDETFPTSNFAPTGTGGVTGPPPAGKVLAPLNFSG